ncbi:MAG: hypothetical protein OEY01_03825 [Desulfobulbaceae bacterium]|nr:hypothetical protein [Desulfobulbaceae bacterium]
MYQTTREEMIVELQKQKEFLIKLNEIMPLQSETDWMYFREFGAKNVHPLFVNRLDGATKVVIDALKEVSNRLDVTHPSNAVYNTKDRFVFPSLFTQNYNGEWDCVSFWKRDLLFLKEDYQQNYDEKTDEWDCLCTFEAGTVPFRDLLKAPTTQPTKEDAELLDTLSCLVGRNLRLVTAVTTEMKDIFLEGDFHLYMF